MSQSNQGEHIAMRRLTLSTGASWVDGSPASARSLSFSAAAMARSIRPLPLLRRGIFDLLGL